MTACVPASRGKLIGRMCGSRPVLREWLSRAFATPQASLDDSDRRLVDRVADFIVKKELSVPALMVLETVRPLSGIGSAATTFLSPYITFLLSETETRQISRLLETQAGVEQLCRRIGELSGQHEE